MWMLIVLSVPFLLIPVDYALWRMQMIPASNMNDTASEAMAIGVIFAQLAGIPIAILAVLPGSVRVHGAIRFQDQVGRVVRSRTTWWLFVYVLALLATVVAVTHIFAAEWRDNLVVFLPLLTTGAVAMGLISLHRTREKRVPIFADGPALDFDSVEDSAGRLRSGGDFPDFLNDISTEMEAARYAERARRRASLCRYSGVLIAAVAGAFIGSAVAWGFSGRPGPQIWAAFVPIGFYFLGYLLQRGARHFERVRDQLLVRRSRLQCRTRSKLVRRASRQDLSSQPRRRLPGYTRLSLRNRSHASTTARLKDGR